MKEYLEIGNKNEQVNLGGSIANPQVFGSNIDSSDNNENRQASFGSQADPVTRKEWSYLTEKQKNDQGILMWIMGVIVIFVVVTFWIELIAIHFNDFQDKSILQQNNQLNKDYSEKQIEMNDKINQQKIEINSFQSQLEILKIKN